ncbi:hypothetical protein EV421DRAFT_2022304 [Armillaria borealis]|uniref:Uncharacterized protein n=1 Tax=Armillaria borealis TaxID=47425 RepID=A0AA39J476_9AGAR|nr:hypothetical protein EV421DRAFT_2022304 [Armillaria borealis]
MMQVSVGQAQPEAEHFSDPNPRKGYYFGRCRYGGMFFLCIFLSFHYEYLLPVIAVRRPAPKGQEFDNQVDTNLIFSKIDLARQSYARFDTYLEIPRPKLCESNITFEPARPGLESAKSTKISTSADEDGVEIG